MFIKGLYLLHCALKSVGDFWAKNHKWIAEFGQNAEGSLENLSLSQFGEISFPFISFLHYKDEL